MSTSQPSAEEVEAVLAKRAAANTKPTDDDLRPVYYYLRSTFVSDRNEGSSTSASQSPHWYCSRTPERLHREAATYLIFLFAFNKVERARLWIQELEGVLRGCEKCSRCFASARRKFATKYMSNFPLAVRTNFSTAVNQRLALFIKNEYDQAAGSQHGKHPPADGVGIAALPAAITQLLLGEPSLLDDSQIAAIIDATIEFGQTTPCPEVVLHGLTPLLVHLLSSTSRAKRRWAKAQMPALARQPLQFDEWCNLGIGSQLQQIYGGGTDLKGEEKWEVVSAIVTQGSLSQDTVMRGVLGGRNNLDINVRSGKGLMAVLAPLLGAPGDDFEAIFACFSDILAQCPTYHMWAFDNSPELPHTLFSDIKNNPSFQVLLQASYDIDRDEEGVIGGLTKTEGHDRLLWISKYLISLTDQAGGRDSKASTGGNEPSGFGEALAKATSFCFSEMQHARLDAGVRAAVAQAGVDALLALQQRLGRDHTLSSFLSSSLDIHASFITSVALRPKDHPGPAWQTTRSAARNLLQVFLSMDGLDIVECATGLATVAYEERLRQRKIKSKKPAGAPVKVDKLRRATIRRELWTMAYNSVLPNDPSGVAIFMSAISSSSHIELLDRQRAWKGDDLAQSISREDWVDGVRAINAGIQATRSNFSHAIEALAVQPDPDILESLWKIPNIPKAATILLLSPADSIHDPILSLISQSFEADERGDCFRELLRRYPDQAVDGLCEFLGSFVGIARHSPESCSLAKWLVRCFTDILDALCQPSDTGEPLLNSPDFLATYVNGISMSRRLQELWHLMTTSLAVIFKRTQAWAPLFDNDVMIDWMRDAIIFGRQMTEHTRMFEAAVLVQSGATFTGGVSESPLRVTRAGKDLVGKLHIVLVDLVSWLRLTDVETLHQTFQLLKDILTRTSKSTPDLSQSPELEKSLLELDKFCRKSSKSYHSRLSDDVLSELSELLAPFNLKVSDEDERLIRGVDQTSLPATASSSPAPEMPPPRSTVREQPKPTGKNAFDELMRGAKGGKSSSSSTAKAPTSARSSTSSTKVGSSSRPITLDDYDDDDDFLSKLSDRDLEIVEKRAQTSVNTGKPPAGSSSAIRLSLTKPAVAPPRPQSKLNVNVVPKAFASSGKSGFKTSVMRDMRKDHTAAIAERSRAAAIGGIVPRLPAASAAGTGLGAYQPVRPKAVAKPDSGSSASESSDEEDKGGLSQLISKQKSPLKPAKTVNAHRSIRVLENPMMDALRKREDERARKARMKMRLKPDLNPLYRHVLGWNPSHTGPDIPHSEHSRRTLSSPVAIPSSFSSAQRYEQVMLPLYLQELWMQALKDEGFSNMPLAIEVTSRSFEDEFLDLEVAVAGQMPDRFSLNDSDIVVLSQSGNPNKLFAKVVHYKRRFKDAGIKLRILQTMDQKDLGGRAKWILKKHLSLSTALREFAALRGLPYYEPELLRDILQGRSAQLPKLSDIAIRKAMNTYEVNEPQARAILGATSVEGFALIQGPPGTGKTKTISGLVGKWVSERPNNIAISGEKVKKAKLLVCAPSNAAIDEVCKRLMNGVLSADGERIQPNLVRIGMEASVNDAVKDRSLDNLVEARVSSGMNGQSGGGGEYARIQAELEEVKTLIRAKQEQLSNLAQNEEGRRVVETEFQGLVTRRTQLGQAASKAKDAARDATRHLEGARRAAKEAILDEADIVCATLSGAGQDVLAAYEFETVIIDEAAQAIEMSCLIPLKYGCKRCIMVGDPNQLPPTTFSTDAERFRYNESLFVRMARVDPKNMSLLSIQYRMHPYISELPSKVFYNSQLKDGPDMAAKTAAVWHERHIFGPYRFFNVNGIESRAGTSTRNADEALAAVNLYRRLEEDYGKKIDLAMRIGVITMYKEQLFELKRAFNQAFGPAILQTIEFNTVDGFQGQEKDIIILSTVRSGPNLNTIGFLKDKRRMNVALTRAKSSLFVIGNASTLERGDERWKTIVLDARERGFVINCDHSTFAPAAPASSTPSKVEKPVKKEKIVTSDRKPRISSGHAAPPASVAAAASPLKRKSVESIIREPKKPKIDVKPKGKPTASAQSSSSSSSSSSDSDSDSSSDSPPPAKKAKTVVTKPSPAAFNGVARPAAVSSSSTGPKGQAGMAPNPPKSLPPRPPPPPKGPVPARPPPPPPAPVNHSALAFIKKKKKPVSNGLGANAAAGQRVTGASGTVRQQMNDRFGRPP